MSVQYSCLLFLIFSSFITKNVNCFLSEGIVGGYTVLPGRFRHQVSLDVKGVLDYGKRSACGGALIESDFVLSSASCIVHRNGTIKNRWYQVRAGTLNISDANGTVVDVDTIYIPKSFNWTTVENNLALIKLKPGLEINETSPINKLALPSPNVTYERCLAKVSGYGYNKARVLYKRTGERITVGSTDYNLRFLHVKIMSNDQCQRQLGFPMTDTEMCGQSIPHYELRASGVCFGDAGGALVHNNQIIGILSKTYFDCIDVIRPSKYTRVNNFLDFIQSVLNGKPLPDTLIIQDPLSARTEPPTA